MNMQLKVLLPTRVLVHEDVTKVVAEAEDGAFGLLPRHIDFAAALTPSIVLYVTPEGRERYLGIDEAILVKAGGEVRISTRRAAVGDDLQALREQVRGQFLDLDEREKMARSALARLEAGVVRRFIELQERA